VRELSVDLLLARAAPRLSASWDGRTDRVAFVFPRTGDVASEWVERSEAMRRLYEEAANAHRFELKVALEAHARTLSGAPPIGAVHCMILGWGGAALIALETADIARLGGSVDEEARRLSARAREMDSARALVSEARRALAARDPPAELAQLLETIALRWSSPEAVRDAALEALRACEPFIGSRVGQAARLRIGAIAEAAAERIYGPLVNAPGGKS
jgi:hypothetical protein